MIRSKRSFFWLYLCSGLFLVLAAGPQPAAQDDSSRFRVNVVLVQLNVAVTDGKGNYISGLRPEDFVIKEDNIPEKIATFEEGSESALKLRAGAPSREDGGVASAEKVAEPERPETDHTLAGVTIPGLSGANVFILFDTSNYMYRSFVFAQDAITDFVRSLPDANKIAFYSYSRDLSRATPLTADRFRTVSGVRTTVAGDEAALYNSLLLTVKDAAPLRGRKAIVVFSNGPDNASSIPPEDVAELAQSTGTIIYIVSTREAETEPISSAAFERMSKATGGKAYFARNWREEKNAFSSIKDDLGHLYTLSYY
ncbi:MAG: VWA domain-containing protein, partial [Terracidiphilus sp.]